MSVERTRKEIYGAARTALVMSKTEITRFQIRLMALRDLFRQQADDIDTFLQGYPDWAGGERIQRTPTYEIDSWLKQITEEADAEG